MNRGGNEKDDSVYIVMHWAAYRMCFSGRQGEGEGSNTHERAELFAGHVSKYRYL